MILSTSTAFNFVPRSLSDAFFFNLFTKYQVPHTQEQGIYLLDCNQIVPSVAFLLDGYWVEVNGADLVIDISQKGDRSVCACVFVPATDEIWVLG